MKADIRTIKLTEYLQALAARSIGTDVDTSTDAILEMSEIIDEQEQAILELSEIIGGNT